MDNIITDITDAFTVGSIVRAKRGSKRCRAMVATVTTDNDESAVSTLCLLWEPFYPKLIANSIKFCILPRSIQKEDECEEVTVAMHEVEALLPFEADPGSDKDISIEEWKGRGDQLLKLGDAAAAASFYEKALGNSSCIEIGGTVVLSVEGFPRMAEVDCCDDDDGTIDVTLVYNGDERTVKQSQVLLGLLERDHDALQERILLNLARCTLQLADLDATNRPKYLKSAILATTLAVALAEFWQEPHDGSLSKNAQTALQLRCKTYTSLSKWPRATADARKLVQSGHESGNKLLATVERKKKLQQKVDKKLARDICHLVQSATAANEETLVSPTEISSSSNGSMERNSQLKQKWETSTQSHSFPSRAVGLFCSTYFILALVTALISILVSAKANSEI